MRYLILDIETTGLMKGSQYPNIVQIAYQFVVYDKSESRLRGGAKYDFIIKPDNYEIPFEATLIHGITNKYATENGVGIENVISQLNRQIKEKQPTLIVHNAEFDITILKHFGLYEYVSYFCTMKYCSDIRINGSDKFLKLTELYSFLFKKEIHQQHDALKDMELLSDCFIELFNRKIVDEYIVKNESNKISFNSFFEAFNKLKVLKSNVDFENRFYGFIGLNGATFYHNETKFNECSYVSIYFKENELILSLMSSTQEGRLKYPLEVYSEQNEHLHLNKQECLFSIFHDLKEFDFNNKILDHTYKFPKGEKYLEYYKDMIRISSYQYKISLNNSFFIGNDYNINGKNIDYFTKPNWECLWENDIVGFIDDNSLVMLIKNDENKFEFCISSKEFIHVKEEYINDWNGNQETDEYISINDFNESNSNILKYFNQLTKE